MPDLGPEDRVQDPLERVRAVAQRDKERRLTALLHHVNEDSLKQAYKGLKPKAVAGVDGVTWQSYGQNLTENLRDLKRRIHSGGYRAKPTRRAYIPKPDGSQRPLGIAALEDKIAQAALCKVLNAIYEEDFFGFSYGFRPNRHPHMALDAVAVGITQKKVNWVLDADVSGFFDAISHERLLEYVERRIGDNRVLRLIKKWLNAGVMEDKKVRKAKTGTPQGATISPLLANVYLHYVLDCWAHEWRRKHARGDMIIVRYADDFVVGFQDKSSGDQFLADLHERMRQNGLELHPTKTRLIEFGRFAAVNRRGQGKGKPDSFDFLGFTHLCGKNRKGKFLLRRHTIGKRLRAKLAAVKDTLHRQMHAPISTVGRWLQQVINGHNGYYGVPTNRRALNTFREAIKRYWLATLRRRSQKSNMAWHRYRRLVDRWLPHVTYRHPWPEGRFAARLNSR